MRQFHCSLLLAATWIALAIAPVAQAEDDTPDWGARASGDWGGARKTLFDRGVDVQANYWADAWSNVSGGISRGTDYIGNANAIVNVDGEKLLGLKGASASLNVMHNSGSKFNTNRIGSVEGIDNIETADNGLYIYEAWIQQNFANDAFSVRLGMFDVNIEFNATESSLLFAHPTYGMDTTIAITGLNGPSTFPITGLGTRLKWVPAEKWVLQFAVMDGVSGDPGDLDGTHVILKRSDGLMLMGELAYGDLQTGRVGIGALTYTKQFAHLTNAEMRRSENLYAFAEKTLWKMDAEGERHVDGFVRMAGNSGTTTQVDYNWSGGLLYTGPFASRLKDAAGIAAHGAHNSDPYRRANTPADSMEWGVEATYSAAINDYTFLQPDVQFVHNPGSNQAVSDAWVLGLRTIVNF